MISVIFSGKETVERMRRFDRILGILLFLRSKQAVSASELARHFEVSTRTIYRDLETLSALGVPLYAELGRHGGFGFCQYIFVLPSCPPRSAPFLSSPSSPFSR